MSFYASTFASRAPDAVIEIAAGHVSVAVATPRGQGMAVNGFASVPLAPGSVVASLTSSNVVNRAVVTSALRAALEQIRVRPRRVALVIPDLAAKVSLVRFDTVPSRREDFDQLLRWQTKKASPFPIDEAVVTCTPGARGTDGSREFLVATARRDVIGEYESVCGDLALHAGLVDLATFSVVNLLLGSANAPVGDWLVVHLQPDYASIMIMRGPDVIFFRNRAEDDDTSIADLVHQTAMYYQDRLAGVSFARAFLGGRGRMPGAVEAARRSLEERLGVRVEPIDPAGAAGVHESATVGAGQMDMLAPLVGMMLRTHREAMSA
jgi:hypothetical protein